VRPLRFGRPAEQRPKFQIAATGTGRKYENSSSLPRWLDELTAFLLCAPQRHVKAIKFLYAYSNDEPGQSSFGCAVCRIVVGATAGNRTLIGSGASLLLPTVLRRLGNRLLRASCEEGHQPRVSQGRRIKEASGPAQMAAHLHLAQPQMATTKRRGSAFVANNSTSANHVSTTLLRPQETFSDAAQTTRRYLPVDHAGTLPLLS
jgi:hypothetical protein